MCGALRELFAVEALRVEGASTGQPGARRCFGGETCHIMHGDAGRRAPANAAQPPPSRLPARPRDPTGPPRRRGRPAEPAAGRWTHHGGHFRLDGAVTTPHPPTRPLTHRPLRLPLPARRFGGPSQVLRRAAAPLGCRAGRCAGRRAEGCCSTTRWAVGTPQNHRYGRGRTRASARPHRRPRAARGRGAVWYGQAEPRRARGWPGARSSARGKAWWSRFDLFRPTTTYVPAAPPPPRSRLPTLPT